MDLTKAVSSVQGHKRRKRIGRGHGSGHGKTSCKGGKGTLGRSGNSYSWTFGGGALPLFRRIPKRGFSNTKFEVKYHIINLDRLAGFADGSVVDEKALRESGVVNVRAGVPIKVLGDGSLSKKLTVKVQAFSKSAEDKIVKAGGKVERV